MKHTRFGFAVLLAVFLAVSAALVASPATAQNREMRALLEELRRVRGELTDLQRHVYRGGTAPDAGAIGQGAATPSDRGARLEVRVGQVEDEMRTLTGGIEEVAHAIAQISGRVDRLIADVDFRLTAIEQGQTQVGAPSAAPAAPGADLSPPMGGMGTLGTVPLSAVEPGALQQSPGPDEAAAPALVPALPTGTPQEQYKYAYDLLRQMEYDEAERALKAFVSAHPDHKLTGNAYYWLAETFYVRGDYEQAVAYFARGYQDFGDSAKAPDNLLKLAMSLARLGRQDDACITFKELGTRFPNAAPAIKRRAVNEGRRAGCG